MNTQHESIVEQFDTKHGSDPLVDEDEMLLYADGARRTQGPWGVMYEPPDDIRQRGPLGHQVPRNPVSTSVEGVQ